MQTAIVLFIGYLSCAAALGAEFVGPPWMVGNAIFHHSSEGGVLQADVMVEGLVLSADGDPQPVEDGFIGAGISTDGGGTLKLQGSALSPHRPLTLSFWWALPRDLEIDGGFSLFGLQGHGYIGWFARGRGEWCALQRPAGVLQVYYFEGIQDVNGIYDFDLMSTLGLSAGAWHHSAVVFRPGGRVSAYCDGALVFDHTTSGRAFRAEDELTTLVLGGGVLLDEVVALGCAVEGEMIRDYERGARRISEYSQ